jgi:hypothetical protein
MLISNSVASFVTIALALALPRWAVAWQNAADIEFFEAKIRPVLIDKCYRCHNSVDTAESSLVLDTRMGVLAGGDNGKIVEPGKPVESRLLAILRHEVPGLEMPDDGERLSDTIIADFEKWIEMGAPDPRDHPPTKSELEALNSWDKVLEERKKGWWSFQPITQSAIPEVKDSRWAGHPVDRFIFSKMTEQGLTPANRAEPSILVRRLFLVLIGLPPTANEVNRWSDELTKPSGLERLVDHLLGRQEYGERWARHWMDWLRYADSHGSEGDPIIENAWQYRDYLIRALNADISFDQLVRENLAGDLLPEPRINTDLGINESMIGPSQLRMVFHGFSPTDALDEKVRFIDDQISVMSKAYLGMTVSCARCHNHKFDPISQEDYYAMFGVLASCRPGRHSITVSSDSEKNLNEMRQLKESIRQSMAKEWLQRLPMLSQQWKKDAESLTKITQPSDVRWPLAALQRDLAAGVDFAQAWNHRLLERAGETKAQADFEKTNKLVDWNLGDQAAYAEWFRDGSGLKEQSASGGEFAVAVQGDRALTGIYPAGVYSHLESDKSPARLSSNYFHLKGKYDLWLRLAGDGSSQVRFVVQDYPRNGVVFPTAGIGSGWHWQKFDLSYWDGDDVHVELVTGRDAPVLVNASDRSWFGVTKVLAVPAGSPAPPEVFSQQLPFFTLAESKKPESMDQAIDLYISALQQSIEAWQLGKCESSQAEWLDLAMQQGVLVNQLDQLEETRKLLEAYRAIESKLPVPVRVPGVDEAVPRDMPLFIRGNHKQPGKTVFRRFLQAIDKASYGNEDSGRLKLAEDILREDNPLTRRVIANRIWNHLFGRGIVLTTDNFGKLGAKPSHPELLDHLAIQFQENRGSIKAMIRYLVTTEAWQLSSRPSEKSLQVDPENQYLSHANLRRLEAEAIRDSLLTVSGQLDPVVFGPPVDSGSRRRSIYIRVQRNALDPFLRAFDFPEPFSSVGNRDVTNVPAQSLAFMNDASVKTWARAWAQSLLRQAEVAGDKDRLDLMMRTGIGRSPTEKERSDLLSYLKASLKYQEDLRNQRKELDQRIDRIKTEIGDVLRPARAAMIESASNKQVTIDKDAPLPVDPIARWNFEKGLQDDVGKLPSELKNGATLENGVLRVGPDGHAISVPLTRDIKAKTLEVWVQLQNLDQRGGGAMSIQNRSGDVFDAIVFGEQSPKQWLAGSNVFERTQPFGGPEENEANQQPVHFAIVYHSDGKIIGYRNGQPYGQAYQSNGPREFKAGDTVIGFGIRHLPAGGNRILTGSIFKAQLYDRALSDEEVKVSFQSYPSAFTTDMVIASLSSDLQQKIRAGQSELVQLEAERRSLGPSAEQSDEEFAWGEIAQVIFSLKEFSFLQ